MFKDLCAELGDPNKSLLFAKLESPILSWGIRKKMITIKKTLTINHICFNISLFNLILLNFS